MCFPSCQSPLQPRTLQSCRLCTVHNRPSDGKSGGSMQAGVLVEDLRKSFGTVRAVDGLSFVVPAGSVGAVLGPNGAGKTTTIRILATLDTADVGRAAVGGNGVTP